MKKKVTTSINKLIPKRGAKAEAITPDAEGVPRITNDTVAEHREEVLSQARKYIYPLQHSRHRIVIISITLLVVAVVAFFTYTLLALYKFQNTSTFMYRITQVIPFPVAKTGSSLVSYEEYLFELRRYMHYYETQQEVDFNSDAGKEQLANFKDRALDGVVANAQIKQLADENDLTVSRQEIDAQIDLLRSQNRLGTNDEVFEDVLQEFWGWSVSDFRRELYNELLAQKVVALLDTEAKDKANEALAKVNGGADFAEVAKQYSDDDSTKDGGGAYGIDILRSNRDIAPEVIKALFELQPGQVSAVVVTPTALEIVKVLENTNGTIKAAHIAINLNPVSDYTGKIESEQGSLRLIRF